MERVACTRCGAMILPDTAERTGGWCMPCSKGLRQIWEHREAVRAELPTPAWDATTDDLEPWEEPNIDWDEPVVPYAAVIEFCSFLVSDDLDPDDVPVEERVDAVGLGEVIDGLDELGVAVAVDWRTPLSDALDSMREPLRRLGVELGIEEAPNGEEVQVTAGGASRLIRYTVEHDFDDVIRAVNELVAPHAELRRLRSSLGTDTYEYAVLDPAGWKRLRDRFPHLTAFLCLVLDS